VVQTGRDASGNANGAEARGFDAYGKPRNANWMSDAGAIGFSGVFNGWTQLGLQTTHRGFTQHEHLDDSQLIHMNGRLFDYRLGRFLGVDPIIQFPTNSQSFNPYAYLMNNPLAGTDPTGYCQTGTRITGAEGVGCASLRGYEGPSSSGTAQPTGAGTNGGSTATTTSQASSSQTTDKIKTISTKPNGPERDEIPLNCSSGLDCVLARPENDFANGRSTYEQYQAEESANRSAVLLANGLIVMGPAALEVGGAALSLGRTAVTLGPGVAAWQAGEIAVVTGAATTGACIAAGPACPTPIMSGVITSVDRVVVGTSVQSSSRVLLDSNVTTGLKADATLGGRILAGEQPTISYVSIPEMRNATVNGNLKGVPAAAFNLPILTVRPSLDLRINIRGMLPNRPGRFGDGIIGGQAIEEGIPLITNDKALRAAVDAVGGETR
jgi:RHS repeat-associated protein